MKHQIILDSRDGFQTLLSELLETFKGYTREYKSMQGLRVTKVRIVVTAIRTTYDADLDTLADLLEETPELQTIAEDRKRAKSVQHSAVYIYPNQMDYVKAGLGRLHIEKLNWTVNEFGKNRRIDERQYVHLCVYNLSNMNKLDQIAVFQASGSLHDFNNKPRRPNRKITTNAFAPDIRYTNRTTSRQ